MEKLNKLQINSERLMKNEELMTLRGGYDGGSVNCCCVNSSHTPVICGTAGSASECEYMCTSYHDSVFFG
jgi:hypothetical protein